MTNKDVGRLYEDVMDRVVEMSMNDFEESGVDSATLQELKQVWQDKLSALKIANFPWDPEPQPPRQAPTVPSNVKQEPEVQASGPPQAEHLNFPNVPIKTERGYDAPMSSFPQGMQPNGNYNAGMNGDLAQQRAQALVAQRLQQQGQHPQYQQHGQVAQYGQQQRMMPGQPQQRPPQQMPQRPSNVYSSQTDGAGDGFEDWNAVIALKAAEGEDGQAGRIAADNTLRAQLDAMASRQDSGLMIPISEMPKGKKRKAAMRVLQAQRAQAMGASSSTSTLPPAPFDGELDDEEEVKDEDAINSDLDDSDDNIDGDGEGDDDNVDYMLCTYDKVQRVKNKWKCTLKDGILTTNKKEYLFHKANGEFEW